MERQVMFDTVARHLHQQGKKAVNSNGSCMYLVPGSGEKCGAGCLIPPEKYDSVIEARSVPGNAKDLYDYLAGRYGISGDQVLAQILTDLGITTDEELALLAKLQSVHDSWSVAEWPQELRRVARSYVLSPDIVERLWAI